MMKLLQRVSFLCEEYCFLIFTRYEAIELSLYLRHSVINFDDNVTNILDYKTKICIWSALSMLPICPNSLKFPIVILVRSVDYWHLTNSLRVLKICYKLTQFNIYNFSLCTFKVDVNWKVKLYHSKKSQKMFYSRSSLLILF